MKLLDDTIRDTMLKRIVSIIYGFNGHIRGDFVYNGVLGSSYEGVRVIDCTLNGPAAIRFFFAMLSIDFSLELRESQKYRIHHKQIREYWVDLSVCDFRDSRDSKEIRFDVDMLSTSKNRLYSSKPQEPMHTAIARVRRKLFCIAKEPKNAPGQEHARAMDAAMDLVKQGWVQDNRSTNASWIVSKWSMMSATPFVTRNKNSALFQQCPICCEMFENDDTIANLPCNHNFHVACKSGAHSSGVTRDSQNMRIGGGIHAWLARGNVTCPCCRQDI